MYNREVWDAVNGFACTDKLHMMCMNEDHIQLRELWYAMKVCACGQLLVVCEPMLYKYELAYKQVEV